MGIKFVIVTIMLTAVLAAVATPALAAHGDDKVYIDEVLAPENYVDNASYKLIRGVTNMVTSPGEIPKQIIVTTRDRGAIGPVLGLFKGIGMTVMRAGLGVWETAFFMFPNSLDGDFSPILKPEYVWDPTVPIRR
jgi:putative exosortase-associated protein (TIGR04073 family)